MGDRSKIEWTDSTWSPVTGCTKVSAGCANCYAERYAKRGIGDFRDYSVPSTARLDIRSIPFSKIRLHSKRLEIPLHWRKPRRIFVCSMGDLFHEAVPDEFIDKVFDVTMRCPHHVFQILTKRAKRMCAWFRTDWPLSNVWLGVSCENQETADERIPLLIPPFREQSTISCAKI